MRKPTRWQRNFQRRLKVRALEKAFEGLPVRFSFFPEWDTIEVFISGKLVRVWRGSETVRKITEHVYTQIKKPEIHQDFMCVISSD